ncbi:hypothetical protein K9U40_05845 [Xanthobacter autotrophicus]|uniref:hypothetical protein n=1 Tax=Xanthobacter TaxID=279 RepID=UPI0024ABC26B|nr:hypothetical protein [Xanthobacter autotrophicus]MDI4663850.1 hypothetical protein [Xanthobacter autotrophicus]
MARAPMRRAGLLVAALVAGWSGPAAALMPPYVYEGARRDAASVIVIAVQKVKPPQESFGACMVTGTVARVERGTAYRPGQAVTIAVPCARPGAAPPIGGTIWQPVDRLEKSRFGRAFLDAAGQVVLSQYEPLAAAP